MTNNAFGLIYTGEANAQLRELTFSRSVAAVPFGGRYRTIDFVLSDIVNSGISNVGLIANRNYHSLMDHLGSGKEWDLHRKRDGLFILPPFVTKDNTGVYRGTVDAIRSVLGYVRRSAQRYVILTGSHTIYNMTFDDMLRQHIETGADVTIMYSEENVDEFFNKGEQFDDLRLTVDGTGLVTDLAFNPYNSTVRNVGCDAYIMDKTLLEYLIEDAYSHGDSDFMQDVLIKNVSKYRFYGYRYDGYVARLNSLGQFYRHNMRLLEPAVAEDLFNPEHPIYTKVKDEVPARYVGNGRSKNSIAADGCVIEGEVENSILFRGVHVGKGSVIKNSILMQSTYIGENCELNCMVLDKGVVVRNGRVLSGHENYPMILRKGAVV
ncbi:MAG: glucose-1-phosphate adenylyltransferase subunit GlgD [Clostridia bacterium]|nr:glucose-1-phosphate adenylyltransferase subunit GlgD [Clostridia bacterium]